MLWKFLKSCRNNGKSVFEWEIGCWRSKNCIEGNDNGSWKCSTVVRTSQCTCRGSGFDSQYPHQVDHTSVAAVPRGVTCFGCCSHLQHRTHRHTYMRTYIIHIYKYMYIWMFVYIIKCLEINILKRDDGNTTYQTSEIQKSNFW